MLAISACQQIASVEPGSRDAARLSPAGEAFLALMAPRGRAPDDAGAIPAAATGAANDSLPDPAPDRQTAGDDASESADNADAALPIAKDAPASILPSSIASAGLDSRLSHAGEPEIADMTESGGAPVPAGHLTHAASVVSGPPGTTPVPASKGAADTGQTDTSQTNTAPMPPPMTGQGHRTARHLAAPPRLPVQAAESRPLHPSAKAASSALRMDGAGTAPPFTRYGHARTIPGPGDPRAAPPDTADEGILPPVPHTRADLPQGLGAARTPAPPAHAPGAPASITHPGTAAPSSAAVLAERPAKAGAPTGPAEAMPGSADGQDAMTDSETWTRPASTAAAHPTHEGEGADRQGGKQTSANPASVIRPDSLDPPATLALSREAPGWHGSDRTRHADLPRLPGQPAPTGLATPDALGTSIQIDKDTARLHLQPRELGTVEILLHRRDGELSVHVHADRPESGEILRRHAGLLAQELRDSGSESARLSFSEGRERQGESGHQQRTPVSIAAGADNGLAAAPDSTQDQHQSQPSVGGRLDLRL